MKNKSSLWIFGVILGTSAFYMNHGLAFVDHLTHYEIHVPEQKNERESKEAEQESRDKGYSSYDDDRGNRHHYENGSEIS